MEILAPVKFLWVSKMRTVFWIIRSTGAVHFDSMNKKSDFTQHKHVVNDVE
jgi:hypothetical protein